MTNNTFLEVNKLQNRYVTDGNIWTIDETFFGEKISLFLVANIKTRAILGYGLGHKSITDYDVAELYKIILNKYPIEQSPLLVHSDLKKEYTGPEVQKVFQEHGIQVSSATGNSHQNQFSESLNDQIKTLTALQVIAKNTQAAKTLRSTQPSAFKGKLNKSKARNREYRKWLFSTSIFQENAFHAIQVAIQLYNQRDFTNGVSREHVEFYNTKIKPRTIENFHLVSSKYQLANQIKSINEQEIKAVEQQLDLILQQKDYAIEQKLSSIEGLLLNGQNSTQEILRYGFNSLFRQNHELLRSNQRLNQQLEEIQQQFEQVVTELTYIKQERQRKEQLRNARAQRKRLPKRQPITPQIYQALINNTPDKTYQHARLRIAFCLLAVTGIRVNELLPLKVSQIHNLIQSHWIAISRSKRGPSSHKAFLTKEGKHIVQDRIDDFQLIFLLKEPDSYIFTSEKNHNRVLTRESITKQINAVTRQVSKDFPEQPNITSHSFRAGYITQLWKDTKDIEFVRQAIGHVKLESTSSYVEILPDEDYIRQFKIAN